MATPLKILFADDDLKYSLLLKRFLEKEGYDVAYTGNGMMVLEQFPVVKPDLVLLDINMPGLNGFEVAEKIRENDRHVLIFFLSDRSDKNDRLKGFSLKGNDYLAKPFYPEELLARIKERFEVNPDVKVEEEIYHFANTVFDYSDSTLDYIKESLKSVVKYLPLLILMGAYSGFICWYGFSSDFLLKSNGVIVSTLLAHLFMDVAIFVLDKIRVVQFIGKF